jgi:Protein of unknown function (DUF2857)
MLLLKDSEIQFQLLSHLVTLVEQGQLDALADGGLDPHVMDQLRELRASDLRRLSSQPLGLELTINTPSLAHQVRSLSEQREAQLRLEYFVTARAPTSLLRELFPISRVEIAHLRSQLGLDASDIKPQALSEVLHREVLDVWLTLRASVDWVKAARAQHQHVWQCLHEHFKPRKLTLATLYSQVLSFERLGQSAGRGPATASATPPSPAPTWQNSSRGALPDAPSST